MAYAMKGMEHNKTAEIEARFLSGFPNKLACGNSKEIKNINIHSDKLTHYVKYAADFLNVNTK